MGIFVTPSVTVTDAPASATNAGGGVHVVFVKMSMELAPTVASIAALEMVPSEYFPVPPESWTVCLFALEPFAPFSATVRGSATNAVVDPAQFAGTIRLAVPVVVPSVTYMTPEVG
jgi:hypothetical protein